MTNSRLGAYETVHAITADPARLILILFDGATRFLRRARAALERGELKEFAQAMSRAHAIIGELGDSLKLDEGNEATVNLSRLYRFMLVHLLEGQIARSTAHLDRVLGLLQTVREGFEGGLEGAPREQ
jgi:flagellar protein FliS